MSLGNQKPVQIPIAGKVRSDIPDSVLSRFVPGVQLDATAGIRTIDIMGTIGDDWDGATARRVAAELSDIGEGDVHVVIHSPGGDYFEGLTIYNQLVKHKGRVTVYVAGIAASAASIIAMAGDEIVVPDAAFLMIHNTWLLAAGNRDQLRETADWLEQFDQVAASVYAARMGVSEKEAARMMTAETWISGQQAVEIGFAKSDEDSGLKMRWPSKADGLAAQAAFRVESALRRDGMSRSNRRETIASLKNEGKPGAAQGGKPGAAQTDTSSAVLSGAADLLSSLKPLQD